LVSTTIFDVHAKLKQDAGLADKLARITRAAEWLQVCQEHDRKQAKGNSSNPRQ
jgi:hypothetical protein